MVPRRARGSRRANGRFIVRSTRLGPTSRAVVHVHSVHATALSSLRRALPPFHYMVAIAGGDDVPCTPYHLFGSEDLSAR